MKTKDQIIDERALGHGYGLVEFEYEELLAAMDEWAMEQAILYAEFRTEYKREEQSRFLKAKKDGTYANWLADSDGKIYAQFLESQNIKP